MTKAQPLGHSLLASEYQLKLLSSQRQKAAASGSKKRIFITAPNYTEDDEEIEKPKKESVIYLTNESRDKNLQFFRLFYHYFRLKNNFF